jgi:hypothetical protein
MKQITAEIIKEYFQNNSIELAPSQERICVPVVNRIYQKMVYGIKFDVIKVVDSLVVEGHHRYVSALLAGFEIGRVPGVRTSATNEYSWTAVELDANDWDTISKIEYLNQKDAQFNNVDIEVLRNLTK